MSYNFWIWKAPKLSDLQDIIVAHKGDKIPVAIGPSWSLSFGEGLFMIDLEVIKVRILTCRAMIDSHLTISQKILNRSGYCCFEKRSALF